jgi:hypothetical protein
MGKLAQPTTTLRGCVEEDTERSAEGCALCHGGTGVAPENRPFVCTKVNETAGHALLPAR